MSTYFHNQLVELDRAFAALVFNRPDVTISSLCWLVRTHTVAQVRARIPLHTWQLYLLAAIGTVLEDFWPGHCFAARNADIARASLTEQTLLL